MPFPLQILFLLADIGRFPLCRLVCVDLMSGYWSCFRSFYSFSVFYSPFFVLPWVSGVRFHAIVNPPFGNIRLLLARRQR